MKKIFVLLLFIAICVSCKKEPHDTVDQQLIDHFNFKPGTYWVYLDSLTGKEDSFFVSNNSGVQSIKNHDSWDDYISIELTNRNNYSSETKWGLSLAEDYLYLQWDTILHYPYLVVYPFKIGEQRSRNGGGSGAIMFDISPSLSFPSIKYKNVAEIYLADTFRHSNDTFFINDEVGIIKMDLHHEQGAINKNWTLSRYRIVK